MKNSECVWPSGEDKPVCLLKDDHRQFSQKTGVKFESGIDDLDEYFGGFVVDNELGPVKFLYYLNAPIPGVVIYVDSLIKTSHAVDVIKRHFNISDSDLNWVRETDE